MEGIVHDYDRNSRNIAIVEQDGSRSQNDWWRWRTATKQSADLMGPAVVPLRIDAGQLGGPVFWYSRKTGAARHRS